MAYSSTKDYYRINWVGNGDLKGNKLAYTLTHVEEPSEEIRELVLRDLITGEEEKICKGHTPQFSPNGDMLLFSAKVNDNNQLFLYRFEDKSITQLTSMRYGATNAVWSPKGDRIAFLSKVRMDCPEEDWAQEMTLEEKAKDAQRAVEQPYVTFSDYGYKSDDDGGFSIGKCITLWSVSVDGSKPVRLSDGDRNHVMPTFTADGENIIFVSNRCRPREESIGMDLFMIPACGGEIKRLTDDCWIAYYPAPFQPLCTPDGKSVVFGALAPSLAGGMPMTRLFRLDLMPDDEGKYHKAVPLWPEDAPCHEATCFVYNCENIGAEERVAAAVSSDSKYIYFISGWHGAANIYRANLSIPEIVAVSDEKAVYRSIRLTDQGYLISRGDFTETPQLYLADQEMMEGTKSFTPKRLTKSNPWFEETLVKPTELWIDTLDGESQVQGFVFEPQGIENDKKYPAVVYVHGGPTPFMAAALTYEHQAILGAGMGLIIMNFRGSSGYGSAHQSMTKAYDGSAMTDILQFTAEAVRRFDWIDGDRLGITGGSFGGYMTNWICGHTKVFKAAVTQRSISNQLIQYASSDMAGSSRDYADFSDFMAAKIKESPVAYAERIDIPFLILHGMNDMRCPVEHAHQLFSAVKETHPDNPVRMILYPGMTHSFPMGGPMELRIAHYNAMIEWFKKYL